MKVKYLDKVKQSDYKHGCIQIQSTNMEESFELGRLFSDLLHDGVSTVQYIENNNQVSIRIPVEII